MSPISAADPLPGLADIARAGFIGRARPLVTYMPSCISSVSRDFGYDTTDRRRSPASRTANETDPGPLHPTADSAGAVSDGTRLR